MIIRFLFRSIMTLITVFLLALLFFNQLVTRLAEEQIKKETGIQLQIENFGIMDWGREIKLYGVEIKNPDNFSPNGLARIEVLGFQYDPWALIKRTVHIKNIKLHMDLISIEKNAEGKINLWEFAQRVEAKRLEKIEKSKLAKGVKVQVDKVTLTALKGRYVSAAGEFREVPLTFQEEEILLTEGGSGAVKELVQKVMKRVATSAVSPDLELWWASVEGAVVGKVKDAIEDLLKGIKSKK